MRKLALVYAKTKAQISFLVTTLLLKSRILSINPFSVAVQSGFVLVL